MSDRDGFPAYMRLFADVIGVVPLPGEKMTVAAFEKLEAILWADAKTRRPQQGEAGDGEKPDDAVAHFVFPPGEHRMRLLGQPFEITSADYRTDGSGATLHAEAVRR